MEYKYWLARERASIKMAYLATSTVARRLHLDLAARLSLKAETFDPVRKLPQTCKRLLKPLEKIVPIRRARPAKATLPLVLICDDEELLLDLLEHHLSNAGFEVMRAADGAIALERLEQRIPAVVILGLMIPVINGTEVLKRIRETPPWRNIPVIILTHRDTEEDVVGALRDGATDYITKPFFIGEVVERVLRLVKPHEHPLESLLQELAA